MTLQWKGARWWRFDFHTHTPSSVCYGKGPDQAAMKARSPQEWLQDYMSAGLDAVVVTDHNTGDGIDDLQNALEKLEQDSPEGFRPLVLFPGVEISVSGGVHVLAILDSGKTSKDLHALMVLLGYQGTPGDCDGVTTKSLVEAAEIIHKQGGLVIPAHVDGPKGLFESVSGQTLLQSLESPHIDALEWIDPNYDPPQSFKDLGKTWTRVVGSDAHHPTGTAGPNFPGSRYTWVKMETINFEGLRLALHDGEKSVRCSDTVSTDPNQVSHPFIESLEVTDARYMGRGESLKITFNPWLTAIIGGRGTGKSTVLEFLRLVFRREGELPESMRADFDRYFTPGQSRNDEGLLTASTILRITLWQDQRRYRLQWGGPGDLASIEEEASGEWKAVPGEILHRFPVRFFSQKQLFELAKDPASLLNIIDEDLGERHRNWIQHWNEERNKYLTLRAKVRELEISLASEEALKGELDDIQGKLQVFEKAGHAKVLQAYAMRSKQKKAVEEWESGLRALGEKLRGFGRDLLPPALDPAPWSPDAPEDLDLLQLGRKYDRALESIRQIVEAEASRADQVAKDWERELAETTWSRSVDAAEQDYVNLVSALKAQGVTDPGVYGQLLQRKQETETRLKDLKSRRTQLEELEKQAGISLACVQDLRKELVRLRRSAVNDTLAGVNDLRLTVRACQSPEAGKQLRELLRCEEGFSKCFEDGLLTLLPAGDHSENWIGLASLKNTVRDWVLERPSDMPMRDSRLLPKLKSLPPEFLDRLDLWFPEDALDVQYQKAGSREWSSIRSGSPGQKTAALLAFFLKRGGREPLILDQPEDDLDNHFISEPVVRLLREAKKQRQIIVVTHNANVVVNGDAELVNTLHTPKGQSLLKTGGCLQERDVRQSVCEVLEGGHKALSERYKRMNLEAGGHA